MATMTSEDETNLRRYLLACREDIAHLRGWTDEESAAWVDSNIGEAKERYLDVYNAAIAAGEDDAAEQAHAAIKGWVQV